MDNTELLELARKRGLEEVERIRPYTDKYDLIIAAMNTNSADAVRSAEAEYVAGIGGKTASITRLVSEMAEVAKTAASATTYADSDEEAGHWAETARVAASIASYFTGITCEAALGALVTTHATARAANAITGGVNKTARHDEFARPIQAEAPARNAQATALVASNAAEYALDAARTAYGDADTRVVDEADRVVNIACLAYCEAIGGEPDNIARNAAQAAATIAALGSAVKH